MGVTNFLFTREVRLVEGGGAAGVAAGVSEGAQGSAVGGDGGKSEGGGIDVIDVSGVRGAVAGAEGDGDAGDAVRAVLVRTAVGRGDLGRELLGAIGAVGEVERRA